MAVVRCDEAATAAAEGSRFVLSDKGLPSGMGCGTWVGELFLGVEPKKKFFFDGLRNRLDPDFSAPCETGGNMTFD